MPATLARWAAVIERLEAGEMPPEGEPRPPEQDVRALSDWIAPRVAAADPPRRGRPRGRTVLRRLNRVEYENTVRDLLGIKINLKDQLPEDGSADGFDNAGAANHTSSFLMEKYLEAADKALNMAIASRPKPPPVVDKRYSIKDGHPVRGTTEDVYRFLDDGGVVCFCSSEWHNVGVGQFYPPDGGDYRFRISASAFQSAGKPVTFRVTATGTRLTGKSGLVGYFDAPPDVPKVFEFVRHIEPRTSIIDAPLRVGELGHGPQGRRREMGGARPGDPVHRRRGAAEPDLAAGKPSPDLRRPGAEDVQEQRRRRPRGGRLGSAPGRCRAHPQGVHPPGVPPGP